MKTTTKINNLTKNILIALVLVFGMFFGFTACGTNIGFDDGPAKTDVIIGNGTSAVVYGDYLYYVNGYTAHDSVGDTNVYGKVSYAAIYRTKLVDGKVVENDKEYDEDGNEIFDKTQGIKNTGRLVSKVCGYEKTQLYIFGNYLYYTTPGNQVAKNGDIESDRIDFCRIKIDGHTRSEKLLTSQNALDSVKYYMYSYNDKAYLVIKDGNILKIGECTDSSFKLKTLDESDYVVSSVAPTSYSRSTDVVFDLDGAVYFTYTNTDITKGNVIAKYDLSTKQVSDVSPVKDSTYTLLKSVGGRLYYNKQSHVAPGTSGAYLYYNNMDSNFVDGEHQLTSNPYSDENITPYLADKVGAYINNTANVHQFNADGTKPQIIEGSATIVAQMGDYIFYTLNNTLYRKNITNNTTDTIVSLASEDAVTNTLSVASTHQICYLEKYENTQGTSYYMHYIDTNITTDDGYYNHFVGVMLEKDYLDEPTE